MRKKNPPAALKKEEKKLVNFPGLLPQAAEGAFIYISKTAIVVNTI